MQTNDKSFSRIKLLKKENKIEPETYTAPVQRQGYSFGRFLSDVGNDGMQKLFGALQIQAKLNVSQPGDAYEQEADRIADTVVSGSTVGNVQINKITPVQKKGEPSDISVPSSVESKINSLKGNGAPLNRGLKEFFEPRFGVDLDKVRIHNDSQANRLSQAIHARAFTHGNDIAFAQGEYKPATIEGKTLIAHEITHVVQQSGDINRNTQISRKVFPNEDYKWKYYYYADMFDFLRPFISEKDFDANIDKYIKDYPWAELQYDVGQPIGLVPGILEGLWKTLVAIKDLIVMLGKAEWAWLKFLWKHASSPVESLKHDIDWLENAATIAEEVGKAVIKNPKIIWEIFTALGSMISESITKKLTEWSKKNPFDQGYEIGEIAGQIVFEIATWFIGVGEAKAAIKGAEVGSKLIEVLTKLKLNKLAELIEKLAELKKCMEIGKTIKKLKLLKGASEATFEAAIKLISKFDKMEEGVELLVKLDKLESKAGEVALFLNKLEKVDASQLATLGKFFNELDVKADLGIGIRFFNKFDKPEDFLKLLEQAAANENAGRQIVLGKYPTYLEQAILIGAKKFNIPDRIWKQMSTFEQEAANIKFLDRAIARGDEILLASPVTEAKTGTAYRKEIDYLIKKGYKLSKDGKKMIR
jgi:hypothetical protein